MAKAAVAPPVIVWNEKGGTRRAGGSRRRTRRPSSSATSEMGRSTVEGGEAKEKKKKKTAMDMVDTYVPRSKLVVPTSSYVSDAFLVYDRQGAKILYGKFYSALSVLFLFIQRVCHFARESDFISETRCQHSNSDLEMVSNCLSGDRTKCIWFSKADPCVSDTGDSSNGQVQVQATSKFERMNLILWT